MATKTHAGGIRALWAQSTVNFAASTAKQSLLSSAIVLTGARLGDPVLVSAAATWDANIWYSAEVTAADAVKVRCSALASSVDPASQLFTVAILKMDPAQEAPFSHRGRWVSGSDYAVDDVVTGLQQDGNDYVCTTASGSGTNAPPNATYWEVWSR
jgi:hypothetical protein